MAPKNKTAPAGPCCRAHSPRNSQSCPGIGGAPPATSSPLLESGMEMWLRSPSAWMLSSGLEMWRKQTSCKPGIDPGKSSRAFAKNTEPRSAQSRGNLLGGELRTPRLQQSRLNTESSEGFLTAWMVTGVYRNSWEARWGLKWLPGNIWQSILIKQGTTW